MQCLGSPFRDSSYFCGRGQSFCFLLFFAENCFVLLLKTELMSALWSRLNHNAPWNQNRWLKEAEKQTDFRTGFVTITTFSLQSFSLAIQTENSDYGALKLILCGSRVQFEVRRLDKMHFCHNGIHQEHSDSSLFSDDISSVKHGRSLNWPGSSQTWLVQFLIWLWSKL